MRLFFLYFTGVLVSFLLLTACLKEDFSIISDDYHWKPSLSLPLKSITFTRADLTVPPSEISATNKCVISKSVDFDFSEMYSNIDYVDSLVFRVDFNNYFPTEMKVLAYYMDSSGSVIKAIYNPALLIKKPLVDMDGSVMGVENLLYDHRLKKSDISTLQETRTILFRVIIEDFDRKPEVLAKSDEWRIDISIGVRSALTIPVEEM